MKKSLKKVLLTLSVFVISMMMVMSSSCSYLIYSIYMKNYEKELIEAELKRREEKEDQGTAEHIEREVYYNSISSGEITGYKMFTIVDSATYTLDSYEYTTPAGGNAYSSKIFHMQGNYTREGNIVTVEPGITMYAYTTSPSIQEFYPGETTEERKSIYESFTGGSNYNIALKSNGTFDIGGSSDSEEAVTGVSGAKVYRWYDDSSRITIKTVAIFEDNSYVLTSFSTHSTNHEQPVSAFIANGTLQYDENASTENYKVIKMNDAIGMCYVSNNGSPMWNDCIDDALGANWWDLSVGSRAFYVTDNGFTYTQGFISEEIPAGGMYGYEESGSGGGEVDDKPEKIVTLQGDKNPAIELTLYKDGTAEFTFTTYNSTTKGTWSYANGEFIFKGTATTTSGESVEFENVSEVNADGSIVIAIDTKNGLTQNFTLTMEQFSEILGEKSIFIKGNSDNGSLITLTLYEDNTFLFHFGAHGANNNETGTYTYENGELVLTTSSGFEAVRIAVSGSEVTFTYKAFGGQATQEYTLSVSSLDSLVGKKSIFMEGNSDNGSLITLTLYEDNTFLFHFGAHGANNNETGTYTYENGELVLTTSSGFEAVRTAVSGSEVTFTYKAFGGQATQEYTLSVASLEEFAGQKSVFMEGNSDNGSLITLTLYEDNTFLFHFGAHGANNNETGTYTYENGELVLTTSSGFEAVRTAVSGSEVTFTYKAFGGQATQEYTLSVSDLREVVGIKSLFAEGNSDNGSLITLTLYGDNTFLFHFGAHGANNNETGTYAYVNGELVLTTSSGFAAVKTAVSGSEVTFTYKAFGGQATQEYTLSVSDLREVAGIKSLFAEGNSDNGSLITLTLYGDNTFLFHFGAHGANNNETGTYTYVNGELVLTTSSGFEAVRTAVSGSEVTFTYKAFGGQATQEYTLLVSDLREVVGIKSLFVEGNSSNGSLITLTLCSDNSYTFHFGAYNNDISEYGKWTYDNGVVVLTVGEKETGRGSFENEELTFKYTYSMSNQLTQEYTISSVDFDKLVK